MRAALLAIVSLATALPCTAAQRPAAVGPLFTLFEVHRGAGRTAEALATLDRLDEALSAQAQQRPQLADAYARLGYPARAISIRETLRRASGGLPYDATIQLAQLYEAAGRKQDAFDLWKSVAREVELPSRRAHVEERLLALGEELDALGDLARALRQELGDPRPKPATARLLVRVYIAMGRREAAIDAARRYQDGDRGSIVDLAAQAEVYRLLGDRAGYARVVRQLVRRDSPRAAEHLRKLVLNELGRIEGADAGEIRQLLEELRRADSRSDTAPFEGGVLALANLSDEAIEAYRLATVAQAGKSDNWLLLGEQLSKQHRAEEALALFAHLAERAQGDALFVTAVDGLMNIATPPDGRVTRENLQSLQWARRRILERIIATGEKAYLYATLEELAAHTAPAPARVSALSESLPAFAARRAATLRELMQIAWELQEPDDRTRLLYGSRLMALDTALPPNVYIDLGTAFLRQKNHFAALRAFGKAVDASGRSEVRVQIARALEKAGLDAEADANYASALIADSRNLDVLMRLGRLRERAGRRESAHELYGKGLQLLLQRQPANGEVSYDYRLYHANFRRGHLATWPREVSPRVPAIPMAGHADEPAPDELQRRRAVMNGDAGEIFRLARLQAGGGEPVAAMRWARGRVSPADYRALCGEIVESMRADTARLRRLLREQPKVMAEIEAGAGRRILGDAALLELLADGRRWQWAVIVLTYSGYPLERFPPESLPGWMRLVSGSMPEYPLQPALVNLHLWSRALERPLPPEVSSSLTEHVKSELRRAAFAQGQWLDDIGAALMVPRAHRDHLQRVRDVVALWSAQTNPRIDFHAPVTLLAGGEIDAAVAALAAVDLEVAQRTDLDEFAHAHQQRLRALHEAFLPRYFERFERALAHAPPLLQYRILHSQATARHFLQRQPEDPAQGVRFLEAALRQPQEQSEALLVQLHNAWLEMDNRYAALRVLHRLHDAHPANPVYHAALFASWIEMRHPARALALGETNLRHETPDSFRRAFWAQQQSVTGAARHLALPVPGVREPSPDIPHELLERRPQILEAWRKGDSAAVARSLRALWQEIDLSAMRLDFLAFEPLALSYRTILDMPVSQSDPRKVIEAVGLGSAELEDYLRPLDAGSARGLHGLYELLAAAYRREGRAEEQRRTLERRLLAGAADTHDTELWLALISADPAPAGNAAMILARLFGERESLGAYALLSMARIACRSGRAMEAQLLYRALMFRTLFAPPGVAPPLTRKAVGFTGPLNAREFTAEIRRSLPPEAARELMRELVRLTAPDNSAPRSVRDQYELFLVSAGMKTPGTEEVLASLEEAIHGEPEDDAGSPSMFDSTYVLMLGGDPWVNETTQRVSALSLDSLRGLAAALGSPAYRRRLSPESRVLVLCDIARRFHAAAGIVDANTVMDSIADLLTAPGPYMTATVSQVLEVTQAIGCPLDPAVLAQLIERGQVSPERLAGAIEQIAASWNPQKALAIAEPVAQYTHEPGLIETMISLADAAGDHARASHWQEVRQNDAAAWAAVGMGTGPHDSVAVVD